MADNVGFKVYELNGVRIIPTPEQEKAILNGLTYAINTDFMTRRRPLPDTRSRVRKLWDDWRHRLGHAWYALKGGECD